MSRTSRLSPPFRGEREGPGAKRWEGEVGIGERPGIPHLTPALSAPGGGELRETALFTIGYEKARLADVVETLARAGIATLIDVRDRPISRRPGFSKHQLAAAVEAARICYLHLGALGTPPEGREANRRRQWQRFWPIVEARLATAEAELALQQAATVAQQGASCLLCYEADWHICHRRRIAEVLAERHGFTVHHLSVADRGA
jgi:uncharacterized protein (DUF488 family)